MQIIYNYKFFIYKLLIFIYTNTLSGEGGRRGSEKLFCQIEIVYYIITEKWREIPIERRYRLKPTGFVGSPIMFTLKNYDPLLLNNYYVLNTIKKQFLAIERESRQDEMMKAVNKN